MLLDNHNTYQDKLNIKEGVVAFSLKDFDRDENSFTHFSHNNFYGIIWSGSNSYEHEVNGKKIIIPKNHFLYLAPNVSQHFISQSTVVDAYYIAFKEEFYSRSIEDNIRLENSRLFSSNFINSIENKICTELFFLNNFIEYFASRFEDVLYIQLVHNLLERVLLNGKIAVKDSESKTAHDDYDVEIATKFKKLLQSNVNENRQVTFYIDQLFVTKRRLDKATQVVFNKSAKQLITDELMKNAKIMLANSGMSVKEIAFELSFFQETNFTAFFKKNAGVSPTVFRQNTLN